MKQLILLAVVILGFTATSFAQLSATASVSATIQTAITITKVNDLNFGNIYTPKIKGNVEIKAQELPNSTPTNVILGPGIGQSAKFVISGTPADKITVSLPYDLNLGIFAGTNVMSVDITPLNLTPTTNQITLDASGLATIYVGGTLHVEANQPAGLYTNTTGLVVNIQY